ncbi:MAG: STAS-like domain-containing protein [Bacteriovorax sp.]|nr:STAS-like domain-containing protein [Bacteriovorax sp.]
MKIIIKDMFKDDYTTRIAGEKLRKMIEKTTEKIILDFSNIKIASASFFDEGIAKLGEENWDSNKVNALLVFENLFKRDKELLISVCENRNIKIEL